MRWLNDSVDAEREANLVEPRRQEPVVSALVESEARTNETGTGTDCGHDLLCPGHLRDALRVDEARDLDAREPRVCESPHELGAHLDLEDLGLVLQPVAWPHVVDRHASHAASSFGTLDSFTRVAVVA